jgi:hypothetical protein
MAEAMDTGAGAGAGAQGGQLNASQSLKRSFIEAIRAELGREPNAKRPNVANDSDPGVELHVTDLIRVEVSKVIQRFSARAMEVRCGLTL